MSHYEVILWSHDVIGHVTIRLGINDFICPQ